MRLNDDSSQVLTVSRKVRNLSAGAIGRAEILSR